jgi:rhodanese-related sulfurtransferase
MHMKIIGMLLTSWAFLFLQFACAQRAPENRPRCANPAFDAKVAQVLRFSTPAISVDEVRAKREQVFLFDTRAREEYGVSHIPGAAYLGYGDFDAGKLSHLPKDAPIVLYCSIGYRSEKIGDKLRALGYTNVSNIYGSIFEWANRGFELVDAAGIPTRRVHTYNANWGRWVDENKVEKTW